ncbi:MAG: DUF3800 domain-containing protein [Betaproteobacteria bacterium]
MLLSYLDESGYTGTNLDDPEQRAFTLAGFALEPRLWGSLAEDLRDIAVTQFGKSLSRDFELHANSIYNGTGSFKNVPFDCRYRALVRILQLIPKYRLTVFEIGVGLVVDPYLIAFPFISHQIEDYLATRGKFGLMIFDEHKEHYKEIDQVLDDLRLADLDSLKIKQTIEKVLFTVSHASVCIQLADVIAFCVRNAYELRRGLRPMSEKRKARIEEMFAIIEPHIYSSDSYERKRHPLLNWCRQRWLENGPQERGATGM